MESKKPETNDRREFLKRAGIAAATVPAVALLLSANAKAQTAPISGEDPR